MKKLIIFFLVFVMLLCSAAFPVAATESTQNIVYLEDGSYIVTTIVELDTHGSRSNTKVGSKTTSGYSADNVLQWKITVTGEFQYDGTTSSCTYASGVTNVVKTLYWEVIRESSTAGSTTAYYNVTFAHWELGVVIDRPTYGVSISCDPDGNLY